MVMSVTVALTSCSSGPATLEDYIADHPEEREALEESKSSYASMEGINFDIQVKDNTIIYLFEMENTVNQSIASEMKTAFENLMENSKTMIKAQLVHLEDQTEIDGITLQMLFLNGDDSEIYNETFEAK